MGHALTIWDIWAFLSQRTWRNVLMSSYRHYMWNYMVLNKKNLGIFLVVFRSEITFKCYIFLCSVCMSDFVATDEWTQSVTVLRSGSFHVDRGRRRRGRGRGGYRQQHRGDQEHGRRESNWWRESKREREREMEWAALSNTESSGGREDARQNMKSGRKYLNAIKNDTENILKPS